MGKMTNRQRQALQTKESIYNAAIRLFEQKGYDNVLIEDITREANCAKGTFYLYFPSKKDLMYETIQKYNECSDAAYEKVKDLSGFRDKLLQYTRYYYEGQSRIGREIQKALSGNNVLDGAVDIINTSERSVYRVLNILIEEGMQEGFLSRQHSKEFYEKILVTVFLGVDYYWCTRDGEDVVQSVVTQMQAVVDGLSNL